MCLLFLSYKTSPGMHLVIAANRDEFTQRATAPLHFVDEKRTILAGIDIEGGGTWLGVNCNGRIAALTNYRAGGKAMQNAPTRGDIIMSYLSSEISPDRFLATLNKDADMYNGFNLIVGDQNNLFYYSNQLKHYQLLDPGFYGLSNHFLDSPWPKLVRGKDKLKPEMLKRKNLINPEKIFSLLEDKWRPSDALLPETGVGLDWERLLSSIYINGSGYGTRSSALISYGYDGKIRFIEKTHSHPENQIAKIVQFSMNIV